MRSGQRKTKQGIAEQVAAFEHEQAILVLGDECKDYSTGLRRTLNRWRRRLGLGARVWHYRRSLR